MSVRVKICGLTRIGDARLASTLGAAYGGLVFSRVSPRAVSAGQARRLAAALDVRRVGVFVDPDPASVVRDVEAGGLDVVQLHGDETAELARSIRERCGVEVWKAVRVRDGAVVERALESFRGVVDGFLFDAYDPHRAGGTGRTFRWNLLAGIRPRLPEGTLLALAGGLSPENVADAILSVRPDIVDVSSGVEDVPGRKSEHRMRAFFIAIQESRASTGGSS